MPQVGATVNLANAGGASAILDYATRADIARVYSQQAAFSRIADNLAVDFRPLNFTRNGDFFLAANNAARDCTSDTMFEDRLEATYRNAIEKMH
jgi:hypothetical protein